MSRIVAMLTAMTVGLTSLGGLSAKTVGPEQARPDVVLQIDVHDAGWVELIDWAVGRYRAIGIQMPAAIVSTGTDPTYCGGNSGQYRPGDLPEVRFCVERPPSSTVSRLIVLHELGHLWAENELSQAERRAFLAIRGLTAWIDVDLPSHEWGAEHAAEVLSWGLMDEQVRIIRVYNAAPESLAEAFVVLTGVAPLVEGV